MHAGDDMPVMFASLPDATTTDMPAATAAFISELNAVYVLSQYDEYTESVPMLMLITVILYWVAFVMHQSIPKAMSPTLPEPAAFSAFIATIFSSRATPLYS